VDAPPLKFDKHLPERRRRVLVTMSCGGCSTCCCCCCCCLHSAGSLLGSAIAPAFGASAPALYETDRATGVRTPVIARPGPSAITMFWLVQGALFLVFLAAAVLLAVGSQPSPEFLLIGPFIAFVILACVLPAYQVGCLILTLIIYAVWPRPDRGYQLIQLAKIGGGIVVGAVVGILANLLLLALFLLSR
jgi:hypothetical protein